MLDTDSDLGNGYNDDACQKSMALEKSAWKWKFYFSTLILPRNETKFGFFCGSQVRNDTVHKMSAIKFCK